MKIIISIFLCLLSVKSVNSQCTGGNFGSNLIFSQTQQTINITGNTYYTFSADSGVRYYIGGGNPQNPSEITILDTLGFYPFTFHSYPTSGFLVNWIAPYSGTFRALINLSPCQTSQINLGQMNFFRYPDYKPFPTDSAQWSVRYTVNLPFSEYSVQYKIKGDTNINGLNYSKVYSGVDLNYSANSDTLHCFLREDLRKVYIKYPLNAGVDTSEILLYNFNLELGDTFQVRLLKFTTDSVYNFVLEEISSTALLDWRTYYKLRPVNGIQNDVWGMGCEINFDWVDGIGAVTHPFYVEIPANSCDNVIPFTVCFWINGIYYGGGSFCDHHSGISDETLSEIIFNNPVKDLIFIEWKGITFTHLEIMNSTGYVFKRENITGKNSFRMQTDNISSGLYLIKLSTFEGKKIIKKIILI